MQSEISKTNSLLYYSVQTIKIIEPVHEISNNVAF